MHSLRVREWVGDSFISIAIASKRPNYHICFTIFYFLYNDINLNLRTNEEIYHLSGECECLRLYAMHSSSSGVSATSSFSSKKPQIVQVVPLQWFQRNELFRKQGSCRKTPFYFDFHNWSPEILRGKHLFATYSTRILMGFWFSSHYKYSFLSCIMYILLNTAESISRD